jgi:glycosyltransferase involved in cell wall biosynthesis
MNRTTTADVSVVTPTRNNLDELTRCLASLQGQRVAPQRVYVCVDGSTDGTLEHLEAFESSGAIEVVTLAHPGNGHRGRPATRNLALEHLGSDYVWFVDSDMVLAPDALEQHLSLVGQQACTSQGQVVYANAKEARWAGYLDTRAYHRSPDRSVLPFNWFSAANALVRTAHVKELHGFDDRLAGYGGEDLDFAYRLERISGDPLINNRKAIATTVETKSVAQAMAQFEEYGATNLHRVEELHPRMPQVYELHRLRSRAIADRLFVAAVNPLTDRVVDLVLPISPRRLRNQFLNYRVVSAVWRGYRARRAAT